MKMYIFYSILLFLSLLVFIPIYFVRIRLFRRESIFLKERLGLKLPQRSPLEESIWIHAVSVGEVLSLQNLIKTIKEKHPGWAVYFSTLTNSGMRVAKEKLKGVDQVFFIPLDFASVVRKFFEALKPSLFVLAESEFWPILLREARRKTGKVLLINGRISKRSFKRYSRFKFIAKKILSQIDTFLVQTEEDKMRLEKIGIDAGRVKVAKNLKSEIDLPLFSAEEIMRLKKSLGIAPAKKVIVAGSTRKGEERMLLEAYAQAKAKRDNLLLILAPRHPERGDEVKRLCDDFPFKSMRRTRLVPDKEWDILILDTLGELAQFYALSDISFIGGSLVPWGGQNLLEPAFYQKPVFFGPHMENFAFLAGKFIQSAAAKVVHQEKDLVEIFLVQDEKLLKEMGKRAKETLNSLQGATEETTRVIESLMQKS
jgi:3-deoxy-D-manno-octulosonic-acid transferase